MVVAGIVFSGYTDYCISFYTTYILYFGYRFDRNSVSHGQKQSAQIGERLYDTKIYKNADCSCIGRYLPICDTCQYQTLYGCFRYFLHDISVFRNLFDIQHRKTNEETIK